MEKSDIHTIAEMLHISDSTAMIGISFIVLWSLYWKARSLWISALHRDKVWFVLLFILSTAGILDIMYIYVLAKPGDPEYENDQSAPKL